MDFKQEIIKRLKNITGLDEIPLEIPPDPLMGDYAFPCFVLCKKLKKPPVDIAKDLIDRFKTGKFIEKVESNGPYLNFFLNKEYFIQDTLDNHFEIKPFPLNNKRIMVEYSQPNTHKEFHVGHLRNVSLGSALVNILRFNGYKVIAANYINDTGSHVAKCLWYITKYNPKPIGNKGEWLGKMYVLANKKIDENEKYREESSEILKKLEKKEKEITALWKKTRQYSLDSFNEVYDWLNIEFDVWFYDHELIEPAKKIVKNLLEKKIAEENEGAIILDLKKYNLHTLIALKSDQTVPYISKDFALADIKFNKYKIDKNIYVVGSEQSLHFQQLFKILELYGFKNAKNCYHLSYELVMLPEGKMASRLGNVILFSELKKKVFEILIKEVKKRHKWNRKKVLDTAQKIAVSALKFGMINQDNNKTIIFNLKDWLSFEGETGPYLQYTHARICSVLRRYGKKIMKVNTSSLKNREDFEIAKLLSEFNDIIEESAKNYKPSLLCRYLLDLAQKFNNYYRYYPIMREENEELRKARLMLSVCVKEVLKNGLNLLGIDAIEEM